MTQIPLRICVNRLNLRENYLTHDYWFKPTRTTASQFINSIIMWAIVGLIIGLFASCHS